MRFRSNLGRAGRAAICCAVALAVSQSSFAKEANPETLDIEVEYEKSDQYRVESQYQYDGRVTLPVTSEGEEAKVLPIEVKARLDYHERFVGSEENPQAVRYYDTSQAGMVIDTVTTISKLEDVNRLIVTRLKAGSNHYQIASVKNTLQQHELELLKNPADPLSLSGLFNKQGAQVGAEWKPSHDCLARFLGVDHVIQSDVKLKLKSCNEDEAKVYILGKLKATIDDVTTSMEVMGVARIDRAKKMVLALRMNITESRKPGQIAPGFEGKSKIDLQISKSEGVEMLSSESLRKISESRTIQNRLKWESESGRFSLRYHPSWKMIAADEEAAVLRYLDNGDLLTQCNIVRLSSRPPSKPLLLEDFEREVAKVVSADATARVTGASQARTTSGLKAMKVTVAGIEEGVPLNWIYYNVAHVDGRQVTFVFTLEEEIAGRAVPATTQLVDGFEFQVSEKVEAQSASRQIEKDAARR